MKQLVLALAFGVLGVVGVTGLSNASLQTYHKKSDLDAWALFNTSSNTWTKGTVSIKSENNEWTLFNTSTTYWKGEGDILPSAKQGNGSVTALKTETTNKSFN